MLNASLTLIMAECEITLIIIAQEPLNSRQQVLNGKLLKTKDRNAKRDIRKELRTLAKEERKRQQLAVKDVIKNADVVLTTLTGAFSKKLEGTTFDLVVIDEAAQALEVACWIALLKVSGFVYVRMDGVPSLSCD
ncbi:hypothetical protein ACLOJK_029210 [Asimina triloba]